MKGFILWNYTRLPDILFIIILLCIFALSVFLVRKIHKKKIYVITVLEITYNNDQKIMIISDDDYAVIRKEGKSYLYRK